MTLKICSSVFDLGFCHLEFGRFVLHQNINLIIRIKFSFHSARNDITFVIPLYLLTRFTSPMVTQMRYPPVFANFDFRGKKISSENKKIIHLYYTEVVCFFLLFFAFSTNFFKKLGSKHATFDDVSKYPKSLQILILFHWVEPKNGQNTQNAQISKRKLQMILHFSDYVLSPLTVLHGKSYKIDTQKKNGKSKWIHFEQRPHRCCSILTNCGSASK